jgi:uncharacterized integral membrane protein (TIGR00698 family)
LSDATSASGALGWGITVIVMTALASVWAAPVLGSTVFGVGASAISSASLAVLLGLLLGHLMPARLQPPPSVLRFCSRTVLQVAIVLLGFKLSLATASALGLAALPIVCTSVLTALGIVLVLARFLRVSTRLAMLIGVGTAICGLTAIAATAPLIRARPSEVGYAVGCISLFGLAALLFYPWFAHEAFRDNGVSAGLFLGAAIHDTSQVIAAATSYRDLYGTEQVLETATVTKLVRNLLMLLVIPGLAFIARRIDDDRSDPGTGPAAQTPLPLFLLGFLAACVLRTIGDASPLQPFGVVSPANWQRLLGAFEQLSQAGLILALTAVGLETRLASFRSLGPRPIAMALIAAVTVGLFVGALLVHVES